MTGIFISYSRVDRPTTEQLARYLRLIYGYQQVWFDENLRGGQMWWDEIRRQIIRNDVFIILISPESLASKYCMKELDEARERGKRIIPILVRARTDVPPEIKTLHMVNMSGGINVDNMAELQAAINHDHRDETDTTRQSRADVDRTQPARGSLLPTRPAPARPRLDLDTPPAPPPAPAPKPRRARMPLHAFVGVGLIALLALLTAALFVLHNRSQAPPPTPTGALVSNPVTPASAPNHLTLLYDATTLTLVNRTNTPLDASNLYFIRETGTDFHSDSWRNGTALGTLAPGECVQLWTAQVRYLPPPGDCERIYWRQVSRRHDFWQGSFNVLHDGVFLVTCAATETVCEIALKP